MSPLDAPDPIDDDPEIQKMNEFFRRLEVYTALDEAATPEEVIRIVEGLAPEEKEWHVEMLKLHGMDPEADEFQKRVLKLLNESAKL
jgi:hypothetical protein